MVNKIFVQNDFIPKAYCDFLISRFDELPVDEDHRDTRIINLNDYLDLVDVKYINAKINGFVQSCYNNTDIYVNHSQIVRWGSQGQNPHYDFPPYCCTTILYLNDEFSGGQTVVGDDIIVPKRGKIVCFNGRDILHKVNDIIGTRYTVATWHCDFKETISRETGAYSYEKE